MPLIAAAYVAFAAGLLVGFGGGFVAGLAIAGGGLGIALLRRQTRHAAFVGDRAVAGNDDLCIERFDHLARGDPVADRARPNDRRTVNEENIAGEHRAIGETGRARSAPVPAHHTLRLGAAITLADSPDRHH